MLDGSPNPYTRDTFALKVAAAKSFQPRPEDYNGQQIVFINDNHFDLLWMTVKQVYDRLAPFTKKVANDWNPLDKSKPQWRQDYPL